jgi:hypothetical protein
MWVIFSAMGFVVGFGQALQLLLANIYLDPLEGARISEAQIKRLTFALTNAGFPAPRAKIVQFRWPDV